MHKYAPTPSRVKPPPPTARIRRLARQLHSLGERPLFEYLLELSHGADPWERLEAYAALAPLKEFIAALDGDRLAPRVMNVLRTRLPNRRASETFAFECGPHRYIATISKFPNGELAEIFLSNGRAGSDVDAAAKDSAILCSLSLQHHVPVETIRKALLRDSRGVASSPLGVALDLISKGTGP